MPPILWLIIGFRGRLSRDIYWPAAAALASMKFALAFMLVKIVEQEAPGPLLPLALLTIAQAIIELAVSVKRLHDVGYPGWLASAVFIPVVNIAFTIWVGILPGTPGQNRFGPASNVQPD